MKLVKRILKKSLPSAESGFVKPLKGIKMMVVRQTYRFIESYENILQKRFPKAFKIYQVFTLGQYHLFYFHQNISNLNLIAI